jgi:hypothetical protein
LLFLKSFGKRGLYAPYVVHLIPPHRAWLTVKPNRTEIRFTPKNVLLRPNNSLAVKITDHRTGSVPNERNYIKPAAVENAYLPQAPLQLSLDFIQPALAEDSESDEGQDVVASELQTIDVRTDELNNISYVHDLLNGLQGQPYVPNELQTPLVNDGDVMRFIGCGISLTMRSRSYVIIHQMRL